MIKIYGSMILTACFVKLVQKMYLKIFEKTKIKVNLKINKNQNKKWAKHLYQKVF